MRLPELPEILCLHPDELVEIKVNLSGCPACRSVKLWSRVGF
jgi:hypothetical protein